MNAREDAVYWAVRTDAGDLTIEDRQRLDAWLAGDRLRRGALLHAQATLALTSRAQAVLPMTFGATVSQPTRRRAMGYAAATIAAGLAAFALVPGGDHLSTRTGEIRRTRLADRSTVTLNTRSRVTIDLEPHERKVALDRGEAWFQIAHDKTRPFIVSAADLRVRAVGTAFSVHRMSNGVDVLVTDGTVEVWRTDRPSDRVEVSRDHRVFVPDDAIAMVPVQSRGGIARALAWRRGGLALAGETLDYAIGEINRYNEVQLRVDDPVLGRAPIVGYFRVDDPTSFARLVAAATGARVEPDGATLRLIPTQS